MKNVASKELIDKLMEYGEKTRLANSLRINRSQVTNWANKRAGIATRHHEKIKELYGFDPVDRA